MSLRLLAALEENWATFDGFAASQNMPELEDLPLGRLVNFVYWYLTREADRESLDKFESQLWMPPVGVTVTDSRSPWSAENETSALLDLQAAFGGTGNL